MQADQKGKKLITGLQEKLPDNFEKPIAQKTNLPRLLALVEERAPFSNYSELKSLRELTQASGIWEQAAKIRKHRPTQAMWRAALLLGDGLLLVMILAIVLVLTKDMHLDLRVASTTVAPWDSQLVLAGIALVSWSLVINVTQAYNLTYAANRFSGMLSIVSTLLLMLAIWLMFSYFFVGSELKTYVHVLLVFAAVSLPCFVFWRIMFATLINLPRFRLQAVIVGANESGEMIAREIRSAKQPGTTILGYISEDSEAKIQQEGLLILGGRSMLRRIIKSGMIDMVIMAIDYRLNPELFQEALEAAQLGITVVPMPLLYERMSGKIPVAHIGEQWYLSLPVDRNISLLYASWHRIMDIAFGLFGTLVLLLIFPVLALCIVLDSPGPVFYSQERLGYQGRPFRILKFRSMRTDAEKIGQAIWAAKVDARVTRVGRFLRSTHLDELPQVLNVLKGEMSLIGPRPERQVFVSQLEKTIPFYRYRMIVKPGLTGWAQVKYPYTSTGEDTMIKLQYDLYYIKHQTFTLDVFILLKTVLEVLNCNGR